MDSEVVKDAFTSFSKNEFDVCKDILSKEFDKKINDYFKSELELENDPIEMEPTSEE